MKTRYLILATAALLMATSTRVSGQNTTPKPVKGSLLKSSPDSLRESRKIWRQIVAAHDQVLSIDGEFLMRVSKHGAAIQNQRWSVGRFAEDFATGRQRWEILTGVLAPPPEAEKKPGRPARAEEKAAKDEPGSEAAEGEKRPVMDDLAELFDGKRFSPRLGGTFVRSDDFVLITDFNSSVVRRLVQTTPAPKWGHMFDVRAIGLANRFEILEGTAFEEVVARYESAKPFSVNKTRDEAELVLGYAKRLRILTVQPRRGYMPVAAKSHRGEITSETTAVMIDEAVEECTSEPVRVGQVWLPKRFHLSDASGTIDIEFKWRAANIEFKESDFDTAALDLRHKDKIIDLRFEKPIIEDLIPAEKP